MTFPSNIKYFYTHYRDRRGEREREREREGEGKRQYRKRELSKRGNFPLSARKLWSSACERERADKFSEMRIACRASKISRRDNLIAERSARIGKPGRYRRVFNVSRYPPCPATADRARHKKRGKLFPQRAWWLASRAKYSSLSFIKLIIR